MANVSGFIFFRPNLFLCLNYHNGVGGLSSSLYVTELTSKKRGQNHRGGGGNCPPDTAPDFSLQK